MIARPIITSLIFAVLFMAAAYVLKHTAVADWLGPDGVDRGFQALIGLSLAVYANYMPKSLRSATSTGPAAARAQAVLRLSGWSFTLAGLAYAALSAFAPYSWGKPLSIAVVVSAMAVTFGYGLLVCRPANRKAA